MAYKLKLHTKRLLIQDVSRKYEKKKHGHTSCSNNFPGEIADFFFEFLNIILKKYIMFLNLTLKGFSYSKRYWTIEIQ